MKKIKIACTNFVILYLLFNLALLSGQEKDEKLYLDDGQGLVSDFAEVNWLTKSEHFGSKTFNSRTWQGYLGKRAVNEPNFLD